MNGRLAIRKLSRSFNVAAPGSNINILATSLTPYDKASTIRVTVSLTTGSVFNAILTQGATSFTCKLNKGAALTAAVLYTFTFAGGDDTTINFQVETNSIINVLFVDEISGGVALTNMF